MKGHTVEFVDGERRKGNEASPEGGTSLGGLLRPLPLGEEGGKRFWTPVALSGSWEDSM